MTSQPSTTNTIRCLIVSGVNITKLPQRAPGEYPQRDFDVLREAFQTDFVDSENYRSAGGPWTRLIERAMGFQWAIAAAAVERARASGCQAIFAMGDDIGVPLGVLLQLSNTKIPYLMLCQHMMSRRPAFFLGTLRMHQRFSQILCMAEAQARYLRDEYHIPERKVSTFYWYTDHRFYRPLPDVAVRRQLCSAGVASRDYKTLIEATRGLDVDVRVEAHSAWFNGEMNFTPDMLHERFVVCSHGTSVALRQLYAESAFVVLPLLDVPYAAGYSTLLEGLAMGKPVIASKIRLIGDFIKDGHNGFLVEPNDPVQLRERIQYLLDHPDEARRMGANARRTIEERFTLDHFHAGVVAQVSRAIQPPTASRGDRRPLEV